MAENFYTHQEQNIWKTWFLMTAFFVFIIFLGWFFGYLYNSSAILIFAIIFAVVLNITSYWYSDTIVLTLSGAHPATRETHETLWNVVENLSITAGLPMPRVYIVEDSTPNAFATGRNKEHAVVCVTSGLLSILDKSELEGVVAHELSHIGNRDILLSTVVVVLAGFVSILSHIFLRSARWGGGDREGGNARGILFIVGIVLAILSPLAATLIQLAISRKREFLADATGALLTRYPEGLASALRKISLHSGPLQKANHATAHLFIANPFGNGENKVSWLSKLFLTHPPVEERIQALTGETQ